MSKIGERPSPWAGKAIAVTLVFPHNYPFKPPAAFFPPNSVHHPSLVDEKTGEIIESEADIFRLWGPTRKIFDIARGLKEVLSFPTWQRGKDEDFKVRWRERGLGEGREGNWTKRSHDETRPGWLIILRLMDCPSQARRVCQVTLSKDSPPMSRSSRSARGRQQRICRRRQQQRQRQQLDMPLAK
jgi:hypothetical protein